MAPPASRYSARDGALPNGPIFCTAWCLIDFIVQLDLDLRYLLNYEILSFASENYWHVGSSHCVRQAGAGVL